MNWVEIKAATIDDDGNETPWDFCIDNVVLEFRGDDDDEDENPNI